MSYFLVSQPSPPILDALNISYRSEACASDSQEMFSLNIRDVYACLHIVDILTDLKSYK